MPLRLHFVRNNRSCTVYYMMSSVRVASLVENFSAIVFPERTSCLPKCVENMSVVCLLDMFLFV